MKKKQKVPRVQIPRAPENVGIRGILDVLYRIFVERSLSFDEANAELKAMTAGAINVTRPRGRTHQLSLEPAFSR